MAQGGGSKRKRGDRTYSQDSFNESSRPSPHRPDSLRLAQQNHPNSPQHGYNRDSPMRGGRRGSRGGRPLNSPNGPSPPQRPPSSTSNSFPSPTLPRTSQPLEAEAKATSTNISTSTQTAPDADALPYYVYDDLTDEVVKSWSHSQKDTIVQRARSAKEAKDLPTIQRIYQEALRSGLDGRIPVLEAADTIKQIVNDKESHPSDPILDNDAAEDFLDVVAISHQYEGHHPNLQIILLNCGIPLELIRINLDDSLLEELQLVRKSFSQSAIRHGTNVLYRMKIHNLLREETEGYSKLVTELFATSDHGPPTPETIVALSTRVNAMIGTFNLDVGRVFDITMDVFAAVLVKHYRFFVKYLRASFWWPSTPSPKDSDEPSFGLPTLPKWALPDTHGSKTLTENEKIDAVNARQARDEKFWQRVEEIGLKAYFELGGRKAAPEASVGTEIMSKEEAGRYQEWLQQTGTLPASGNKVAAQIFGLKLRFYESPCRDEEDVMPSNLIYLAALLIKIGFISLFDLYAHLWPSDDAMDGVRAQKKQERDERDLARRPGGGQNALTRAGALSDDTLPLSSRKPLETPTPTPATNSIAKAENPDGQTAETEAAKKDLPEPVDQKIQLLRSLLCIGALPESLYLLGRFPWLLDLVPDIPEHIHRILHHSLSPVYEELRPLSNFDVIREPAQIVDPDQSSSQKGDLQLVDQPLRKVLRWPQMDKSDSSEGIDYRFYWEDWADNIPMCHSVDDVFQLCRTLLNLSGLKIGRDPLLLAKLVRIGMRSLDVNDSEHNNQRWFDLCKRLLVPALSFSDCNSGIVSEVWALLKRFPTAQRYNIYAEWFQGQTSRNNDLVVAFEIVKGKTKDVLKRISKTNTKTMARALAKVAVSSPGKVFEVALNQIESYDNLIDVVVESSRYFTDLAYDILTWSLVNALGKSRSRVQEDGMLTSKWLSALGSFSGSVFKRYSVMNPTPVLQYVAHQLRGGNSTDLVVLENLVHSMAGIIPDATFNDSQVLAMAGGPHLRGITLQGLHDKRHDSSMRTSARRLMRALINPKLAGFLLVLICQQRQACVFNYGEDNAPLKLLGNLFDEVHRVLTQYVDLLHTNLAPKDFVGLIPSVAELLGSFGIQPNVAFWIWRPIIAAEMVQHDRNSVPDKPVADEKTAAENKDDAFEAHKLKDTSALKIDESGKVDSTTNEGDKTREEAGASEDVAMEDAPQPDSQKLEQPESKFASHPVIQKVAESVRPQLPPATFEVLSQSFYFTFWRLSPYDLYIPDAYQDECRKLMSQIERSKTDRSDQSSTASRVREQHRKHWTEQHSKLSTEHKEHLSAHLRTRASLLKEKDLWFEQCSGRFEDLSLALLEYCFLPRMSLSALDAFFVFKMFKFLHSQGTKNFKTISIIDSLFNSKRLTPFFFMCTAKEAEHVGRFLNEILKDLARWHASAETFEKEAHGPKKDLFGFYVKGALLSHENFKTILSKWHAQLADALKACFGSGEYMHIRNAIIVLKAVVLTYPSIRFMGEGFARCLEELSKSDSRSDLKLAAVSLLGNVKRRESQWISKQEFSLNKPSLNGTPTPKAEAERARTPQPDSRSTGKALNAKAPEFIPNSSSLKVLGKADDGRDDGDEDGEVKDAAAAKAHFSTLGDGKDTKQSEANSTERNVEPKATSVMAKSEAKDLPAKAMSNAPKPPELPTKPDQRQEKAKPVNLPPVPPRPRSEASRNHADTSAGRSAHILPDRPEATPYASRLPNHRPSDRADDRAPRDANDIRDTSHRRSERPFEATRDPPQEKPGAARRYDRQEESYHNDREKRDVNWGGEGPTSSRHHDDRHTQSTRDTARPPLREERSDRSLRDRPYPDSRDHRIDRDPQGPRSRDNSMAPPRPATAVHSDRATALQASQDLDRSRSAAHADRRSDVNRSEPQSHSSQRGSRTSSPTRREERSTRSDYHGYRDDRASQENRRYGETSAPLRHEEPRLAATTSRPERLVDAGHSTHGTRTRDNLRSSSHTLPIESNAGRPSQDFRGHRQPESQYGRLNQDPPIGPRMVNGAHGPVTRSNRNVSAPQGPSEGISPQAPAATSTSVASERPAPTGPAPGRGPARNQPTFNRPPPITTSIPPASVAESPDTAGVHPDRLKAIQSSGLESSTFARKPPTPVEAPVGPRAPPNVQSQEVHPSVRSSGPPVAPSDRGRGDKRFAGINNVLSQTGIPAGPDRVNQGTSIRGRHARQEIAAPPQRSNGPPRRDFPPSGEQRPPQQQDLFANRPSGGSSGPQRGDEGAYERDSLRSSDRKPAPRQRSMSPRRDPPPARVREDVRPTRMDEPRDYRGRGGPMAPAPLMPERDRRGPPLRDNAGPAGPKERRDYDRKEDWGGDRMGPDRRDRPERRASGVEDGLGMSRKRVRGPDEAYDQSRQMSHEYPKRPRRGG